MFKAFSLLLLGTILISFTGCAWVPFGEDDYEEEIELESWEDFEEFESEPEIDELKDSIRNAQLQQEDILFRIEVFEEVLISLSPRISEIENSVDHSISADIEKMQSTVRDMEFELERIRDKLKELILLN